jgi:nitrate/nitrite-specific signal transduction histidine kinase
LSRTDVQIVKGVARQAATAIINARLYDRAAQMAIEAERIRVDNVLHDTLRQTLFSIGLRIERGLRPRQPTSALRAIVREIKEEIRLAMTQVNGLIPVEVPAALDAAPGLDRRLAP